MSEQWPVIGGLIGTGLPHPLLVPEQNAGWGEFVRDMSRRGNGLKG